MIGIPPGGTIGVKPSQIRDKPKRKPVPPRDRMHPRDEELRRCIEGREADKIAWAEQMADAPGRDERTGRFVSLKKGTDG